MPSHIKETIWELDPHTEAKHIILRNYLNPWLAILGNNNKKVLFIDGFAGPGEYKGGEDGSPIIAIKAVLEHKAPIGNVFFAFIEEDSDRCQNLKNKLDSMKLPSHIRYECICGEFAQVIGSILDTVEKQNGKLAPTFAFIDPFGINVPFEVIRRLMSYERCEVLINFMYEAVNRCVNAPQAAQAVTKFYGTEEWKKIRPEKDEKRRRNFLHQLYQTQLQTRAGIKHVRSFRMINDRSRTGYYLFFGTKHDLGLEKMKEAMWKVDQSGGFEFSDVTFRPDQTVLFEKSPNFSMLKKMILENFKGKKVSAEGLENFVLVETPFLKSHYKKQILMPMEEKGEIKIHSDSGRRKSSYPNGKGIVIEFL